MKLSTTCLALKNQQIAISITLLRQSILLVTICSGVEVGPGSWYHYLNSCGNPVKTVVLEGVKVNPMSAVRSVVYNASTCCFVLKQLSVHIAP